MKHWSAVLYNADIASHQQPFLKPRHQTKNMKWTSLSCPTTISLTCSQQWSSTSSPPRPPLSNKTTFWNIFQRGDYVSLNLSGELTMLAPSMEALRNISIDQQLFWRSRHRVQYFLRSDALVFQPCHWFLAPSLRNFLFFVNESSWPSHWVFFRGAESQNI